MKAAVSVATRSGRPRATQCPRRSSRRSEAVAERVTRDFRSGLRAGVVATPTLVVDGRLLAGEALSEAGEEQGDEEEDKEAAANPKRKSTKSKK